MNGRTPKMSLKNHQFFESEINTESLEFVDMRIREMEEAHGLLNYQVDNWCIWPLFRHMVSKSLRNVIGSKTHQEKKWSLGNLLIICIKDLFNMLRVRKAKYIVFASSLNRREQQFNGLYKDVYFDDLLLNLDSYIKIEHLGNREFVYASEKALIKSNFSSTLIIYLAYVLTKIHVPNKIIQISKQMRDSLLASGIEDYSARKIRNIIGNFYWGKKLYRYIFLRIQPDYLLLINAYNDHTCVAAAKEIGTTVVEFQHGFINRHHYGYSWSKSALFFKQNMPIAEKLLVFGDYWKQELSLNEFWGDELIVSGSLRVEKWRQQQLKKYDITTLVLTTQDEIDANLYINFLKGFLDEQGQDLTVQIFIKLHQAEANKSTYEKILSDFKNVHLVSGSESPSTFELLAKSHFHMSVYSTCHFEALALGTPTIILPFKGYEAILPLFNYGHAFIASTPQNLFNLLQKKHPQISKKISYTYFASESLNKMTSELC
jgi:hypothetical protein